MMRRSNSTGVLTAVVLSLCLLTACSERRSTEPCALPEPPEPMVSTKLRAMHIRENPMAAVSDTLWGRPRKSTEFEKEFVFRVTDSLLAEFGRVDEIILRYKGSWNADLLVYNVVESTWQQLEQGTSDPPVVSLPWPYSKQLLSQLGSHPAGFLIDDDGILRIGGSGFNAPGIQLLRYHDDYRTVTVAGWSAGWCRYLSRAHIAAVDGQVWVLPKIGYWTDREGFPCDSLYVLDSTGGRVLASEPDNLRLRAMTYGDGAVWILNHGAGHLYEMATMDVRGQISPRFRYWVPSELIPVPSRDHDAHLAWGFARLWLLDAPRMRLLGMPAEQTIDRGYADCDWRFSLRAVDSRMEISGITCDGSFFYVLWHKVQHGASLIPKSTITKINLSGEAVCAYPVPVRSTGGMAWDGEAMWLVHTGPLDFESTTMMLSRFYLP